MAKLRFLIGYLCKKSILFNLSLVLLVTVPLVSLSAANALPEEQAEKQQIVRQVAQKWIEVGMEQYKRGFFREAEQSFLRAQDYQKYLTAEEREKLKEILEKTHIAALERKRALEHIQTANELIDQGELSKSKTHLEKAKESEFLTEHERALVEEGLKNIDSRMNEQKKEINELYQRSVELYDSGNLEEARESFLKVVESDVTVGEKGRRAEDYLTKIDSILAEKAQLTEPAEATAVEEEAGEVAVEEVVGVEIEVAEVVKPEQIEAFVAEVKAPEEKIQKPSYIEVINRRRNLLRSHTRAVVNDAVAQAQNHIIKGEFDKAIEKVEVAERMVNENQLQLGDELFSYYSNELQQLTARIVEEQTKQAELLAEQRRIEAIEAQHEYRQQVEADRQKRMAELMDNAMAYQKQQRYEEALGQLVSLLAIDPLNNEALILKQTLEDTVTFRKQLEIQKERDQEREKILVRTDEAAIPWADEITYPKNWREIAAKRKPEEAIGQDEATVAVYKQLAQIVDLSEFRRDMTFAAALEILRLSVDPPLKIIVLWRDLYDNADIDQTTVIGMDPISAIPLGTGLELLLQSVSGGFAELGYIVEEGVITIATVGSLPSKLETLVYDVTDLLGQPAQFFASTATGTGQTSASLEQAGEQLQTQQQQEQQGFQQMQQQAATRAQSLVLLIQDTVEPDTWYDYGGEGSITVYQSKKLIVRQTRDVHNKIETLLKGLRKALGYQVAIEARFLVVSENFLEDVGLDVDIPFLNIGGKWGIWRFMQGSFGTTMPFSTGLPGSLGADPGASGAFVSSLTGSGGYGTILDDLQVSFLIRATQAHADSTALTAPKVNVLSGESATLQVQRTIWWASDIDIDTTSIGGIGEAGVTWDVDFETAVIPTGTIMNITPTITPDKKYVLLNIVVQLQDFLGFRRQEVQIPVFGAAGAPPGQTLSIEFPQTELSMVQTRVSVPDRGTILLGGQKLTADVEREAGVPVLSKIPIIGRAFTNRSKVKDHKILLILVKPTIILQEEVEAEAIAALETGL
ncbi:MAG: type II secretion system protein GspD [Planctomycetota bacterium]|jgi:type II secretory pathway component GspD/PulD (secretin)